jgi:hypothetical protein
VLEVSARACGGCTACCVVMGIAELGKPMHQDCPHLITDQRAHPGCAIYAARPRECASFRCAWLSGLLRERDRPDLFGVMVTGADPGNLLIRDLAMQPLLVHEVVAGALDQPEVRAALCRLSREHVLVLLRGTEELGILAPKYAVRRINQWNARKRAGEAR